MTSAVFAYPLLAAIGIAPTPAPKAPPVTIGPASTPLPQIRDIAPPIDVFLYPLWMVIVAGCLAAIVLGVIIWLLVRWLRRPPAIPPLLPREVALKALEAL